MPKGYWIVRADVTDMEQFRIPETWHKIRRAGSSS